VTIPTTGPGGRFAASLLRAVGIGHEFTARIDSLEWRWARPDLLAAGILLLVPIGWWIIRRHRARMPWLSPRLRGWLSACRIGALAVLVFILGGPYLVLEEEQERRPAVAIVLDVSASMETPVGPLSPGRIQAVVAAIGREPPAAGEAAAIESAALEIAPWPRSRLVAELLAAQSPTTLRQLADRFDLRRYDVAAGVRRRPDADDDRSRTADGRDASRRSATGGGQPLDTFDTALGTALERAMDDASDRRLAGIVLLTDGRSTIGPEPEAVLRRAAEASAGVPRAPVFTVPIGSPVPPDDLVVTDVLAPPEATLDDTITITAGVSCVGFAGRPVTVELRGPSGELLETRSITIPGGDASPDGDAAVRATDDFRGEVSFSWKASRIGTSLLEVAVVPEASEAVEENNTARVWVDVSDRRTKALVLDHVPRWDMRFLDHAIRRDTGFEPTLRITGGSDSSSLPRTAEEWAAWDLVLLGDVPADLFDSERQRGLVEAVQERGIGVVFQPGPNHLPRAYRGAALAELFPVDIDWTAGDGSAFVEAADFKPLRLSVTPRGAMHPAFALGGDGSRNRERWSEMPAFFRAAAAVAPRPAATVLADVEAPGTTADSSGGRDGRDPLVLVAEAPSGSGRVAWIGTDETFRWRRDVGDALFWRFWGQALRSVARREDRPADASWMAVSPRMVEPGSPVSVELSLVTDAAEPDGQAGEAASARRRPVEAAFQPVTIHPGDGIPLELKPAGRPGLYAGSFTPDAPGRYEVRHLSGRPEGRVLAGAVVVERPRRERRIVSVDREGLRSLADLSGGDMVEIEAFSSIPYRLDEASTSLFSGEAGRPPGRTRLEDDVWDTWPVLLVLVGLLCADIAIRRLTGSS
jgi:hypothetical protein